MCLSPQSDSRRRLCFEVYRDRLDPTKSGVPSDELICWFVLLSMDVHGGRRLIGRRPTFSSTSVVLKLPAIFYVTQVEIIKRQTHNTSLETENFFSDIHPLVGYCYFHGRIVFGFFFFFFFLKERNSISRLNNSNTQSDCTLDEFGVCFEKTACQ